MNIGEIIKNKKVSIFFEDTGMKNNVIDINKKNTHIFIWTWIRPKLFNNICNGDVIAMPRDNKHKKIKISCWFLNSCPIHKLIISLLNKIKGTEHRKTTNAPRNTIFFVG